jgi:hypothetical protein
MSLEPQKKNQKLAKKNKKWAQVATWAIGLGAVGGAGLYFWWKNKIAAQNSQNLGTEVSPLATTEPSIYIPAETTTPTTTTTTTTGVEGGGVGGGVTYSLVGQPLPAPNEAVMGQTQQTQDTTTQSLLEQYGAGQVPYFGIGGGPASWPAALIQWYQKYGNFNLPQDIASNPTKYGFQAGSVPEITLFTPQGEVPIINSQYQPTVVNSVQATPYPPNYQTGPLPGAGLGDISPYRTPGPWTGTGPSPWYEQIQAQNVQMFGTWFGTDKANADIAMQYAAMTWPSSLRAGHYPPAGMTPGEFQEEVKQWNPNYQPTTGGYGAWTASQYGTAAPSKQNTPGQTTGYGAHL